MAATKKYNQRSLVWLRNRREEKWKNYQQEGERHYINRSVLKIITARLLMPEAAFFDCELPPVA
jgi:hypothetical protein